MHIYVADKKHPNNCIKFGCSLLTFSSGWIHSHGTHRHDNYTRHPLRHCTPWDWRVFFFCARQCSFRRHSESRQMTGHTGCQNRKLPFPGQYSAHHFFRRRALESGDHRRGCSEADRHQKSHGSEIQRRIQLFGTGPWSQ